jgi:hypothetical protein
MNHGQQSERRFDITTNINILTDSRLRILTLLLGAIQISDNFQKPSVLPSSESHLNDGKTGYDPHVLQYLPCHLNWHKHFGHLSSEPL